MEWEVWKLNLLLHFKAEMETLFQKYKVLQPSYLFISIANKLIYTYSNVVGAIQVLIDLFLNTFIQLTALIYSTQL